MRDLLLRLIDGVVDFLEVDAGGDVEGGGLGHTEEPNGCAGARSPSAPTSLRVAGVMVMRSSRGFYASRSARQRDSNSRSASRCDSDF